MGQERDGLYALRDLEWFAGFARPVTFQKDCGFVGSALWIVMV